MRRSSRITAIASLVAAGSLAFSQPAFAATTMSAGNTQLIYGTNSTVDVELRASGITVSGHIAKIGSSYCDASTWGRMQAHAATKGYLDSTYEFFGAKISSASAQASLDGLGGSVSATTTKVTWRAPRQKWSNDDGKRYSKSNLTVDGGNASAWTYVRLTCTAVVNASQGDTGVSATDRS